MRGLPPPWPDDDVPNPDWTLHRPKRISKKLKAPKAIPPALLAPTASPYVYISKPAVPDDMDTATLFREADNLPKFFASSQFEYLSPNLMQHDLPKFDHIGEVAFLGRSNVGKSSLINALMRRNLCKTSKSPGRTQLPYYYGLFPNKMEPDERMPGNALGYAVDLPGYGYAKGPDAKIEQWQMDTQDLLQSRHEKGTLKRLFVLIDSRHGCTHIDSAIMGWMDDAGVPYSIVLTKADQTSIPEVIKHVNEFCMRYASTSQLQEEGAVTQSPVVHVTSSKNRWGLNELLMSIETEFISHG